MPDTIVDIPRGIAPAFATSGKPAPPGVIVPALAAAEAAGQ